MVLVKTATILLSQLRYGHKNLATNRSGLQSDNWDFADATSPMHGRTGTLIIDK